MAHNSLRTSPKLATFMAELGVDDVAAVGHLQWLWWAIYDQQNVGPDGTLRGWTPAAIAAAAHWRHDPQKFLRGLVRSGFVDVVSGQGNAPEESLYDDDVPQVYAIHDLRHWAPEYVKRRWRRNGEPCPDNVQTSPAHTTQRNETRPDPTQRNATQPEPTGATASAELRSPPSVGMRAADRTTGSGRREEVPETGSYPRNGQDCTGGGLTRAEAGRAAGLPVHATEETGWRVQPVPATGSGKDRERPCDDGNTREARDRDVWCQLLCVHLAEALRLDPVRLERNRKSLFSVARRAWKTADREAARVKLLAAAKAKAVPGVNNPAAAWQAEIDRWLPKENARR